MSFHEGDLQSGIAAAIQQQKAVLCFVHDESDRSTEWESALQQEDLRQRMDGEAVAIKIRAESPEAGFLTPICPITSTPAVIVIKNAALQANIQAETETSASLAQKLTQLFGDPDSSQTGASPATTPDQPSAVEPTQPADLTTSASAGLGYIDLPPSAGQPRLPNNAYDALREFTGDLKAQGTTSDKILDAQLNVLSRLPIFKDEVQRLRSRGPSDPIELSQSARDRLMLRLPAAAIKAQMKVQSSASTPNTSTSETTPSPAPSAAGRVYPPRAPQPAVSSPPTPRNPTNAPPDPPQLSQAQLQQQSEYRQMQRDREAKARTERERIKQQIKADKEERRRREQVQKQNDAAAAAAAAAATTTSITTSSSASNSLPPEPATNPNELRVQVRTFDGSLLRSVFMPTSTIASDLRPWIDAEVSPNVPYDFKLILTPMPNRKIEAAEEAVGLRDLGVRRSCTFVIAPVKGYVESYTGGGGGGGGLVGSVIGGGYNLVAGTVGGLLGGVGSLLGYGGGGQGQQQGGGAVEGPGRRVGGGEGEGGEGVAQHRSMRVRTLADQRAEEQRGNQFYNGNALNFQPNKDDERKND